MLLKVSLKVRVKMKRTYLHPSREVFVQPFLLYLRDATQEIRDISGTSGTGGGATRSADQGDRPGGCSGACTSPYRHLPAIALARVALTTHVMSTSLTT